VNAAPASETSFRAVGENRPTVTLIATARPTFVVEAAQARAASARALLTELGAEVTGPADLLMTRDDVADARSFLTGTQDVVIHVCASFSDASPALELYADLVRPLVVWAFREPGPVGDRLWLNSLCGANLYGHALSRIGRDVRLVYGDAEEPAVREALTALLAGTYPEPPDLPRIAGPRAEQAEVRARLARLAGAKIGVIGEAPPGFTPSEFDPDLVSRGFGLACDRMSIPEAFDRIDAVPADAVETELAALRVDRPTVTALDPNEVARHAAITSAFRDWQRTDDLKAIAVRCWPEFPTDRQVCPCSSLSRLADEGTATVCERDVYGAVTMLLMEALGSGTTYLVDTVDLDADRNVVRLWHCGSAATSLAADPSHATQSVHCNRRLGVVGDFALKTGPVIVARLTEDISGASASGLRLLLAAGESLPGPNRFQGNTADVQLEVDGTSFVHALVAQGFPHHTVLAWTDVRPQLRTAADLLDIDVVEWAPDPRPSTRAYGGSPS
jgi:hypothetical protein